MQLGFEDDELLAFFFFFLSFFGFSAACHFPKKNVLYRTYEVRVVDLPS